MFAPFFSLLSLATIALASYGLGRPIVRGLGVGEEDRLSTAVWSLAAGLVAAGMFLAALGLVGLLYPWLIGVLSVAASFWGIGQLVAACSRQRDEATAAGESPPVPWPSPPRWMTGGILLLAALACLGSLVSAMAPPTAGDALCYHLELPKAFLADHAVGYLPYSENSTYPLLAEMWYLWALALDGGVAAQLVHWGLGVLLGLATVVLATPLVGRPWAWWAGATVVLVPGVNNQMTAPLNDVALVLFVTLAVAAWWRGVAGGESRRWFVLAGLAAGGALGTKYLAMVFAAAVAIASVWIFWRHAPRRRSVLEAAAIVTVVAISVGGWWYVRAAWHRGNPVYPFLSEVFPSTSPGGTDQHETLPASKSPLGRNPLGAIVAPWQVTMHPERFGGRGHQLGVLLLAAVPGVLVVRRLRGLGILLGVGLVYGVLWYLLRQNVRFLLPVVPLLSVAVVWVWIEMGRFPLVPRLAAGTAFAGILALYAVVPLARCGDQVAVALGLESREDYLLRHEPTWQAAEVSNQWFPAEAQLLTQDYRAFHFQCRVTRENVYRRATRYDRQITDPADFSRTLREAGFTHVLLAENVGDQGIRYDPTLSRLAEAQWSACAGDGLVTLADYRFPDVDGGVRRYRLVALR
ncbi:MAG: phospholipid carrier-dependent glycosyltransferase [Planctomycetota bacterium]